MAEDTEPVVRERSCEPEVFRLELSRGGKRLFVGALISSESSSSMSSVGVDRPLTGSAEVGCMWMPVSNGELCISEGG
jgi:hypothetical protein